MSVTLYFETNTEVMIATKTLRDVGIAARMIPRPAGLEASANLCLSVDDAQRALAVEAIRTSRVTLGGVLG